jgi:xanthine/CO dehydrogenase XdhC/CoxF family maturation factor
VTDVLVRAGRLAEDGRPFALVTVVRVEPPVSARQGDRALVLPDGALVGWFGGACSESIVVREALRALADGEARLVRARKECAFAGTVELLLEPQLPAPLLAVVGDSPSARTVARLAAEIGWRYVALVASARRAGVDLVDLGPHLLQQLAIARHWFKKDSDPEGSAPNHPNGRTRTARDIAFSEPASFVATTRQAMSKRTSRARTRYCLPTAPAIG